MHSHEKQFKQKVMLKKTEKSSFHNFSYFQKNKLTVAVAFNRREIGTNVSSVGFQSFFFSILVESTSTLNAINIIPIQT